jgi:hypothetical protein
MAEEKRPTSNVQRPTLNRRGEGRHLGFLDFARNDGESCPHFLISVFAGDWPD